MTTGIGIYRNETGMKKACHAIRELRKKYLDIRCSDVNTAFNTELLEILELGNLLDLSLITAESARNRKESRGAHSREDFPERDDENWLKHTMAKLENDGIAISYKDVDITRFKPKPRVY